MVECNHKVYTLGCCVLNERIKSFAMLHLPCFHGNQSDDQSIKLRKCHNLWRKMTNVNISI